MPGFLLRTASTARVVCHLALLVSWCCRTGSTSLSSGVTTIMLCVETSGFNIDSFNMTVASR